jgi:hypothetical protein|tara:strand:+ start:347 stop:559 length:213 start_codon:yes stop_codon:yes gene_type:complete
MTFEKNVPLNVQEIGIILSALEELDRRDEYLIAREYGSVPTLYNKLNSIYDLMDKTEIGIRYEPSIEPSF